MPFGPDIWQYPLRMSTAPFRGADNNFKRGLSVHEYRMRGVMPAGREDLSLGSRPRGASVANRPAVPGWVIATVLRCQGPTIHLESARRL